MINRFNLPPEFLKHNVLRKTGQLLVYIAVIGYALFAATPILAENAGGVSSGRAIVEEPHVTPAAPPHLPPLTFPETTPGLSPTRIDVRQIIITGSTVFTVDDFRPILRAFEDRALNAEDLETLRRQLTQLYIDHGFINSGAILPDQKVHQGVIYFQIIEGELSQVEVIGHHWMGARYYAKRLERAGKTPLNVHALENRLRLLQQDGRIRRFNAGLQPGLRPGQSLLKLQVEEQAPIRLHLAFNNYLAPSIGSERAQISLENQSLTGHGDRLRMALARSAGLDPQITASYSLPLTSRDTLLTLEYRKNDFLVAEEQFRDLNIQSKSNSYGLAVSHPLWRSPTRALIMRLALEKSTNETYVLGERFSLTRGAENGRSRVVALRCTQTYTRRSHVQMLHVQSRLSMGLNVDNATRHDDSRKPDGNFLSWLGQLQWVRRLPWQDSQIVLRTNLQIAGHPLLALEQIAVGGRYSIRGYRENLMVRDNALSSSLELHLPLVQHQPWVDTLWFVPFVDHGRAWNTRGATPAPDNLTSVGLGLVWELTWGRNFQVQPQVEIFWGHALKRVPSAQYNLQDDGIHFQFALATLF